MYSIVIYALKKSSPLSEVIPMEPREIKGLEIAAKSKVIRKGKSNLWLVPSQAGLEEKYTVEMKEEKPRMHLQRLRVSQHEMQTHLCC